MRLRQNSVLREHNDHVVVDDGARQGHSRMQILDGYGFQSKFLLWETVCIMRSADKTKSSNTWMYEAAEFIKDSHSSVSSVHKSLRHASEYFLYA